MESTSLNLISKSLDVFSSILLLQSVFGQGYFHLCRRYLAAPTVDGSIDKGKFHHLFYDLDGGFERVAHGRTIGHNHISDGADEAYLYGPFQDILVDIAQAGSTSLGHVLGNGTSEELSLFNKDIVGADGEAGGSNAVIEGGQPIDHDERLLLGQKLVDVNMF